MRKRVLTVLKVIVCVGVLLVFVVIAVFGQRVYRVFNPPVNHVLFWVGGDDVQSKLTALISDDEDINQTNSQGRALIHLAAQYGTSENLRLLIEAGANVRARTNLGQNVLHFAVDGGTVENIQLLLKNGAEVNESDNFQTYPLHRAVSLGASHFTNGESVSLLLSAGANINVRTLMGDTPVHWAATSYYPENNLLPLLKAGVNPNDINNNGESPLHVASKTGSRVAVELLLGYGADVSMSDKNGFTALDYALKLSEPFPVSTMEKLSAIYSK